MSEKREDNKVAMRLTLALVLAFAAGALNYYCVGGAGSVKVLAYAAPISPGKVYAADDFKVVALPIKRDRDVDYRAYYRSVFRTPDELSILLGSSATVSHAAGDLVLKGDANAGNPGPPVFDKFGDFLVLGVNDRSITVEAAVNDKKMFTEEMNRLIQLTSSGGRLGGYQVVNVVEIGDGIPKPAAEQTPPKSDAAEGEEDADDGSMTVSVSDLDRITVTLPPTCQLSGVIKPGVRVAFVVPPSLCRRRSGNATNPDSSF